MSPRAENTSGQPVEEIPQQVILGKIPGEWPLHLFESRDHATRWYEANKAKQPKMWLAKISSLQEMQYLEPSKPKLVIK